MKLLHAADFHLDSPFAALSPEQAAQRRSEQRALLERLAELCRTRGASLLLLAGDLFDGERVYKETVNALREALAACPMPVLIAPGNHDSLRPDSPYLTSSWPENVHIFTSRQITAADFPELDCRVYGAGFQTEHCEPLLEGFRAKQDGRINLMVLHGDAAGGSDYNPITPAQVAASGLDYLALGHIHKRGTLEAGGTLCAWPGCAMGRGFDETGEKGLYELTLDGSNRRLDFLPLGARRYEILEIPATDDPLAAVTQALPAGTESDIYRILLTGESTGIDLPALEATLAPRFFSLQLRDRTVPPQNLWEGVGEDTLKGRFLAGMKARMDHATSETEREALLFGLRAAVALFDGREAPTL